MTTFDRLKTLCEEQKLSIVELEEKLGFGRNSLYGWKKKIPNGANLEKVADYFNVSVDYLLGRTDKKRHNDLTEKDIAKRIDEFKRDLASSDGLNFSGEPMSEDAKESLIEAMDHIFRQTQRINKKYIPNKYKKDED
ncbi:helix-turn-helix domain-containing protein [Sporosarcina limicola]|uniref:Transcriptional regulator with XRE-family HTH domain n=1 Tax=Sporosarcina limicola TaxID=34101 RepID=A0A927MHK3_9BACL|nr:helix-turn-helix transcriptional regulator [Sporosarcina limicola]MBE1554765.1 transcriptional regulator with XRE-family HTH domain [Sporosarcina limicola]